MTATTTGRFLTDDDALRALLQGAGVRPTTHRMALGRLLFAGEHRHFAASELHLEAAGRGLAISVATVYNTLGQFVRAGLLREVTVDTDRTYFDTNVAAHCHVYDETHGVLRDVPLPDIGLPEGVDPDQVRHVELLFRVAT